MNAAIFRTRGVRAGLYAFVITGMVLQSFAFGTAFTRAVGVGDIHQECAANGFDGGIVRWEWNGSEYEREDPEQLGFTTSVSGDTLSAPWTATPAVAGLVRKAGQTSTVFPGGTNGLVTADNEISHLTFCTNFETQGSFCGDGEVQTPNDEGTGGPDDNGNEQCDDGNALNGDGCSSQCVTEFCGDGVRNNNEQCEGDEGVGEHKQCSTPERDLTCTLINLTHCGDGITQNPNDEGVAEQCDGQTGLPSNQSCTARCQLITFARCGDGIKNGFEECDGESGDFGPHQRCSEECSLITDPFCGDGQVNQTSEQCDDANLNNTDSCTNSCQTNEGPPAPVCGNDALESGEQCDDDNTQDGDGCSSTCQLEQSEEPFCGDGNVNQSSEQCDDGNENNSDACTNSCHTNTPPPTVTSSGGGGGGGGGGAFQPLSVFNEVTLSVSIPQTTVTWFTNVSATCTALYDSISHDTSGTPPTYGYALQVSGSTSNGTFHTAVLTGLSGGTTYFWRPYCTSSAQSALGQQLTIASIETPQVLGIQAPVQENVKVLGFEKLPETGGDMTNFYRTNIILFSSALGALTVLYRRKKRQLKLCP